MLIFRGALSRVYYGWWLLVAGGIIAAVGNGILWYGFTVFFIPMSQDLGISYAATSLLYGSTRLEGGLEGPIVGRLIDRLGPRRLIMAGTALTGVGFLLLSQAQSFLAVFLIYVCIIAVGYNAGFFFPISTAVNSWFIRRRAMGMAVISAAGSVGGVVLVPVLSYLVLTYGWRTAALFAGVITLVLCLPLALPFHRSPESRGLVPDGKPAFTNGNGFSNGGGGPVEFTVKQALKTANYWMLTASITLRIAVTTAVVAHMVPMLVWKGLDQATGAYLVSMFAMGTVATTMVLGWIGDRWSKTRLSAMGILVNLLGLLLLLYSQSMLSFYLFAFSLSIVMGTTPLNWSLIGDYFGRRNYATLRGIMNIFYAVATFITPIFAGWIFDRTRGYNIALLTFVVIFATAAFLFFMLRHPRAPVAAQGH